MTIHNKNNCLIHKWAVKFENKKINTPHDS